MVFLCQAPPTIFFHEKSVSFTLNPPPAFAIHPKNLAMPLKWSTDFLSLQIHPFEKYLYFNMFRNVILSA
tara:strand:- start:280 stop:489 length:210 start_codon:yes stop_codon:yes gene_type:complete